MRIGAAGIPSFATAKIIDVCIQHRLEWIGTIITPCLFAKITRSTAGIAMIIAATFTFNYAFLAGFMFTVPTLFQFTTSTVISVTFHTPTVIIFIIHVMIATVIQA